MKLFVFLLAGFISAASSSMKLCMEHCQNTYSLHTNEKVEGYDFCLRGCRFLYLNQLTILSNSKQLCSADCTDVYSTDKDAQYACNVGCAAPVKSIFPDIVLVDFDMNWHSQILQPMVLMKKYCSGMVQDAMTYMYSYENYDGGAQVVMQIQLSSPDIEMNVIEPAKEQDEDHLTDRSTFEHYMQRAYDHGSKWLSCVEEKSGIPYIHLVSILMLSLLFIAWIWCSTCDSANAQQYQKVHSFGTDFSINSGDIKKLPRTLSMEYTKDPSVALIPMK